MGEFFPKVWENTKFFPNFSDKFVPKIGESPNLSSNFGTNSSPNLVNPQISPQLSGQIRPQIWWFPKFVLKFGENFFPKFGESPNLSPNFGTNSSPNLGNPQICPQISGQIRPQICPQKAREHTSSRNLFCSPSYYASETLRKKDSSILFSICPFIFCVSDTSDYLLLNSHWHSQHCLSLACHMRETHSDGTMAPVLFSGTYLS